MIHVLMVGVSQSRVGGMSTVAKLYLDDDMLNREVQLKYIPTSTSGTLFRRAIFMLVGYARILVHLLIRKTDIVHVHMAEKGSVFRKGFVIRLASKLKKKTIIHLHAGAFMGWYSSLSGSSKRRVKNILNSSDSVVVLGEYWKKEISALIPEKKIVVIYNGVQIPMNNPYSLRARNITYFGVLKKEKGIYDLLDAVRTINDKLESDIKIVLCGKDLDGGVEKTIIDYKLEERVEMTGWVSGSDKKKILQNAMINVLPSYYEGLSMSVIEGIAHGVPTIATKISTMPEILGKNAFLARPGNAHEIANYILELVNSGELRLETSNYVYKRAKEMFSIESFITNTLMLYNSLMGEKV